MAKLTKGEQMKFNQSQKGFLVAAVGLLVSLGVVFPVQAQRSLPIEAMLISQGGLLRVNIGRGTILEYNSSSGTGVFRDINSGQIINTISTFRKTWSAIVYIGDDRIFFYDRQAGEGEIYTVKQRRGELSGLINRANTYRKTWQQIYSPRPGFLTFVDLNGDVATYLVDSKGNLKQQ
jgi:hypothetical protein